MAPRTKAAPPAAVDAARGPQPASPIDQLRATQARLQQEQQDERQARQIARSAAPGAPTAPLAPTAIPMQANRATALNRQGQPVQRTSAGSGIDQFAIPMGLVPQGWTWAWKNETVLGQPNEAYMASLRANGWEEVRAEAYPGKLVPELLADGTTYRGPVRRHGMILMEQPESLTLEARREEKMLADAQVNNAIRKHRGGKALETQGAHGVDLAHHQLPRVASKSIEGNIPNPGTYDRLPVE